MTPTVRRAVDNERRTPRLSGHIQTSAAESMVTVELSIKLPVDNKAGMHRWMELRLHKMRSDGAVTHHDDAGHQYLNRVAAVERGLGGSEHDEEYNGSSDCSRSCRSHCDTAAAAQRSPRSSVRV